MNVKKFERLIAEHPWLLGFLATSHHLHSLKYYSNEEQMNKLRTIIRTQYRYIAFRPFSMLDLMWLSGKQVLRTLSHSRQIAVFRDYSVMWHGDSEPRFDRREHLKLGSTQRTIPTVGEICTGIVEYHAEFPSALKEIHFDAVIKESYVLDSSRSDRKDIRLDIFQCPIDWVPEWMRHDKALERRLRSHGITIPGLCETYDPAGDIVLPNEDDYPLPHLPLPQDVAAPGHNCP